MTIVTSTSPVEIIPANATRKSLAILNEDSTEVIYIKREYGEALTVSATDHDWKIGPGGAISFNSLLDGSTGVQSRYTVVAGANTPRIAFFETEDIKR